MSGFEIAGLVLALLLLAYLFVALFAPEVLG